jgi:hypothetical protein
MIRYFPVPVAIIFTVILPGCTAHGASSVPRAAPRGHEAPAGIRASKSLRAGNVDHNIDILRAGMRWHIRRFGFN